MFLDIREVLQEYSKHIQYKPLRYDRVRWYDSDGCVVNCRKVLVVEMGIPDSTTIHPTTQPCLQEQN